MCRRVEIQDASFDFDSIGGDSADTAIGETMSGSVWKEVLGAECGVFDGECRDFSSVGEI